MAKKNKNLGFGIVPTEVLETPKFPNQHEYRKLLREMLTDLDQRRQVILIGEHRVTGMTIGGGWLKLANGNQIQFHFVYSLGILPVLERMTGKESAASGLPAE